jgi:cytidylate kinase
MPDNLLIPSVDLRIGALEEYNRRQKEKAGTQHRKAKVRPCLTISREFGCEGYLVAERLVRIVEEKTGDPWVLIDRAVLDEVSRRSDIAKDILSHLGERSSMLAEVLATFSPRWKTDHDYFQLICSHVISLAEQGNVIIIELGGAVITRHIEHSHHFRIIASEGFKASSIAKRLFLPSDEAETMVKRKQKERDKFHRDFLGQDIHDPYLYDLVFNNDCSTADQIAAVIADYAMRHT